MKNLKITLDDFNVIATTRNPYNQKLCLTEKEIQRAKIVLIDGIKQSDVARDQGVSRQTVNKAVRRAIWIAIDLGVFES
jgi:predicted DNA-binding protein (UPF0251 family)